MIEKVMIQLGVHFNRKEWGGAREELAMLRMQEDAKSQSQKAAKSHKAKKPPAEVELAMQRMQKLDHGWPESITAPWPFCASCSGKVLCANGAGARTTRQLPRTSSNNKSLSRVAQAPLKRVFAPRPRRSPQRVARPAEIVQHLDNADPRRRSREHEFLHLDHDDPRTGSRGPCTSTTPIPAEGGFS